MTRFILVRHGFSAANKIRRFAGHYDVELTDIGHEQAKRCAEALKNEKVDAVYTSDLRRAYDTARPIAAALGLEITPREDLREIFAGEWEGKLFCDLLEEYPEAYGLWKKDIGRAECTGGESVKQLSERILGALAEIAAHHDGKTVLVTTHATPIRAVCAAAVGLPSEEMAWFSWAVNASINVFTYENGNFTAVALNQKKHLEGLETRLPTSV